MVPITQKLITIVLQWGSKIWSSLDFEWSKRGWITNGLDFEWDLKSGSQIIWNPDKCLPFCHIKHLKSRQKYHDLEWSGFWMVGTIAIAMVKARPFEIWPTINPNFNCFWIFNGLISDLHSRAMQLKSYQNPITFSVFDRVFLDFGDRSFCRFIHPGRQLLSMTLIIDVDLGSMKLGFFTCLVTSGTCANAEIENPASNNFAPEIIKWFLIQ